MLSRCLPSARNATVTAWIARTDSTVINKSIELATIPALVVWSSRIPIWVIPVGHAVSTLPTTFDALWCWQCMDGHDTNGLVKLFSLVVAKKKKDIQGIELHFDTRLG